MEWLAFAGWLCWWLGGTAFALWVWTLGHDEVEVTTATIALAVGVFLGPIVGLLWWPKDRPLWQRKR